MIILMKRDRNICWMTRSETKNKGEENENRQKNNIVSAMLRV
jgi:hypothetical protein